MVETSTPIVDGTPPTLPLVPVLPPPSGLPSVSPGTDGVHEGGRTSTETPVHTTPEVVLTTVRVDDGLPQDHV